MFKVRAVAFNSPARLGNWLRLTSLVTTFPAVGLLILSTDSSLMALRWNYEHVAQLHYSECSIYSKIPKGKPIPQITIHGNVNVQVNVAGQSIDSPALNLSLGELMSSITASDAPQVEKAEAKSRLQELLAYPVVAAIVGGLAGRIGA